MSNKHLTAIPLRSTAAGELGRSAQPVDLQRARTKEGPDVEAINKRATSESQQPAAGRSTP